jgi:glycosyltransferase involved in cell wall biosynthesis
MLQSAGGTAGIVLRAERGESLVRALAEAIDALRSNDRLYEDCCANAKALGSSYDIDAVAKTYEATFRRICCLA